MTHTARQLVSRIFAHDVDGLVSFYERVTGLEAARHHPLFAELSVGSATLAIASTQTASALGQPVTVAGDRALCLDFLVDDVDACFTELRTEGVPLLGEPTTMPWGNRSLLLRDPDGRLINLFTPVTAEARRRFGLDHAASSGG
ncbi:catechol 2,3-dioxygenase-like lactoylglutathione lyase family enzyme [Friedmanniella endophytica]|uniref:Catechol 2,3-dioxygenase-like lactoylglutathione lyase family enzyme n=1 Tax=Microlunatus kandeliicorticis TaxID=1759536 RepID=A0A7W3IT61_9ACTN|nr:VOC family protein [Microlunatus kandeliicorticis]MBA8794748.1 catechol 2,3-dioxygenase-like lactoylglutathione lyase family enzyme [Microlunatus kandeliicorticis]